jgi:signal-transduction protein with cAMP-binding, CBS, and nucleotidyltransferase domain
MAEHAEVEIVRSSDPVMLPTNATVMMAARQMHSRGISAVLVVEDNAKLVGIFTERDAISRVLAQGRDPVTTTLAEVMTDNPDSVSPQHSNEDAVRMMHAAHCRHLPIVEGGKVVGLVLRGRFRAFDEEPHAA